MEFRVGRIFGDGFRVLGGNLLPFLFLTLIVIAPVYLFLAFAAWQDSLIAGLSPLVLAWGPGIAEALLGFVAQATVVYGTFRQLQGRRSGFAETVVSGLRMVLPAVLVAVAAGVMIAIGFAILVVPGLMFTTAYWVAVPVAVVEGRGVSDSLLRSADLTTGFRWKIFGVIAVVFAIQMAIDSLAEQFPYFEGSYFVWLAAYWVISAATTALGAVLSTVTYRELRRVKEGAEVDEIAAVFD